MSSAEDVDELIEAAAIFASRRQWERSAQVNEKIAEISRKQKPDSLIRAAIAYSNSGNFSNANKILSTAQKEFPNDPIIFLNAANIYENQEEWNLAISAYENVALLSPDHSNAIYSKIAFILKKMGSTEEISKIIGKVNLDKNDGGLVVAAMERLLGNSIKLSNILPSDSCF